MSSVAIQKMLQEVVIIATGRGATAAELADLEGTSGPKGDYAPLVSLINQYMGDLAAKAGTAATLKTIAMNGLGLALTDSDATAAAASITAGKMTWADAFIVCINLTNPYGTTLDNRADAAYGFLASLSSASKSAYFQGDAVNLAVANLLSGIGSSATSLDNGKSGLDALAANISSTGIQSAVADGYVKGATVFVDTNGDGKLSTGEFNTTTDVLGNFVLPANSSTGKIIAFGGTDLMTGKPFQGVLTAPAGSTVVNPITTLVQAMVANGQSIASATAAVQTALGLPANINPLSYDPIAVLASASAGAAAKTAALPVQAIALQVANVVTQAGAAIDAAGDATRLSAGNAVIDALAKALSSGTAVDLGNVTTLANVIQTAATAAGAGSLTIAQVNQLGQITSASNTAASTAATITDLARVAVVAQGSATDAITTAVSGGTLAGAVTAFTGGNLTAAVGNAQPGVVPGITDSIAPTMNSALVPADGRSIVVSYSEPVGGTPEAGDYAVTLSSGSTSVTGAAIGTGVDANKVTLTLSDLIATGLTVSNLVYTSTSGTANSIKDLAPTPNNAATQILVAITNGSTAAAPPASFTVTENGSAVLFGGTATGDISLAWSGSPGASVATFTRGGITATTTPSFTRSDIKISLGAGQTLADTAADLQGFFIVGAGNVTATALDAKPAANLSLITNTGTRIAAVENDVTFIGDLATFTVSVAAAKTLTAAQSVVSGKTINGTGNVTVTGVTDATTLTNIANTLTTLTLQGAGAADTINASTLLKQGVAIDGGAGADILTGGDGADQFIYSSAADMAAGESVTGGINNGGRDKLVLKGAGQSYNLAANLTLSGVEEIDTSSATGATGVTLSDAQLRTGAPAYFTGSASAIENFTVNVAADTSGTPVAKSLVLDSSQRTLAGLTAGTDKFVVSVAAVNAFTTSYSIKLSDLGDQVTLTNGNNVATGGSGNDTITGGSGNDTIDGGAGADSLTGGGGADTFVIGATGSLNSALDTLTDYTAGTDLLKLAILPVSMAASAGADFSTATSVASTGTTTGTLATDIATAVAAQIVVGANLWANLGDTIAVTLTGTSLAGTGIAYIVQNQAANATYDAAADTVIALVGTSTVPNTLANFTA